jgi:flagellar biogenesis protein FliO
MSPVSGTSELISVAVSLIVILALLLAVARMARRWQAGGRIRVTKDPAAIKIVAVQAAGWQSSLQIVEADGQRFLIAAGRNGITGIGRLSAADAGRSMRSGT